MVRVQESKVQVSAPQLVLKRHLVEDYVVERVASSSGVFVLNDLHVAPQVEFFAMHKHVAALADQL
jgi:hypothetical protein